MQTISKITFGTPVQIRILNSNLQAIALSIVVTRDAGMRWLFRKLRATDD